MATDTAASTYRADIDGLRAVAVGAVVLYHAGLFHIRSGFVGVDIFFVISGYLINGLILRAAAAGRFSYLDFYGRRARRILPALLTVVVATLGVGFLLLNASEYTELSASATPAVLGASNFYFWQHQDYFNPDSKLSPLLMTWSLGVEEQFYLIVPAITLVVSRGRKPWVPAVVLGVIGLASFAFSIWQSHTYPSAGFYLLPARAGELAAGGVLAAIELARGARAPDAKPPNAKPGLASWQTALGVAGLAMTVASLFAFTDDTPFPGAAALLPVAGAVALIASSRGVVGRYVLASPPLRWTGLISYSWYLWHWPIMVFVRILSPGDPARKVMAAAVVLSFLLAIATWAVIEQPFRRRKLPAALALGGYGAAVAAVALAAFGISVTHGLPSRLPPQALRMAVVHEQDRGACVVGWGVDQPRRLGCIAPPGAFAETLALVGDSHAGALGPGLRQVAARRGAGVAIFGKSECPSLLGVAVWRPNHPRLAAECMTFQRRALAAILADPSVKTVLLASNWDLITLGQGRHYVSDPPSTAPLTDASQVALFRQGLLAMVEALRAGGKRVVIVSDVPYLPDNINRLMVNRAMPLRGKIARLIVKHTPAGDREDVWPWEKATRAQLKAVVLQTVPDVPFFDAFGRLCRADGCLFAKDGLPLFVDNAHLTPPGAAVVMADPLPF